MPFISCPETPNTKCMGKFATPVSLGHLMHLNFHELDFFWHHCTHRELLYMYQIQKVTKQTRGSVNSQLSSALNYRQNIFNYRHGITRDYVEFYNNVRRLLKE